MQDLSFWDVIFTPIYFVLILMIGSIIKKKYILKYPQYKYLTKGLLFKLIGSILFCMVYSFYYDGGDTNAYFRSAKAIANLFSKNFSVAFSILTNHLTMENHHFFDYKTGIPEWYMYKRAETFAAARYTVPFVFLGMKSFFSTSLLLATFSYIGVWKLFMLFTRIYPDYTKNLAISILYIPSFVFWGSGIMKDTYIVGAVCWFTYNFYKIFIVREKVWINFLFLVFNFWLIATLKAYIISALFLGMFFWLNSAYLNKIKSIVVKAIIFPFIIVIVLFSSVYVFNNISELLGDYGSLDSAIEKAQITQKDLLREEQYGSNNYDLGEIDGSLSGLLKKAPLAIFTAIYRPSIIEVGSITVLFSVIENTILLLVSIYILLKTKPIKLLRIIKVNPIIQYSLAFSLVLAFGVGLASANFGALVRYKIPVIPFFFSSLFILHAKIKE